MKQSCECSPVESHCFETQEDVLNGWRHPHEDALLAPFVYRTFGHMKVIFAGQPCAGSASVLIKEIVFKQSMSNSLFALIRKGNNLELAMLQALDTK